jgi:hypothetical protein
MFRTAVIIALSASASLSTGPAFAHGGGLNAEGCHNNRKTGDYHCHRGSSGAGSSTTTSDNSRARLLSAPPRSGGAFANCTAARAAGAAPVRRGDPGYGAHLDQDGDGVGCE